MKKRIKREDFTKKLDILFDLKEIYNLSDKEVINLINKKKKESIVIPVSILKNRSLGLLEIIVKYLKEEFGFKYHEIAVLLNRDDRTIWTTYKRVKKKGF